eukprot:scaffold371_cov268-Chaetoceros_neogracile.AAC.6
MSEHQGPDQEVYYSEVISAAALALSQSKSSDNSHREMNQESSSAHSSSSSNRICKNNSREAISSAALYSGNSKMYSSSATDSRRNSNGNSNSNGNDLSQEEAALLSSLPMRPVANFPSESDRKRVIGMLATIMSMIYQFEQHDYMDYCPIELTKDQQEQEDRHADGDADFDLNENSGTAVDTNRKEGIASIDSFEHLWERTSPTKKKDISRAKKQAANSNPKQSTNFASPPKQNGIENAPLARYRRRRHQVYSEFLVMAADLLFLDKSNAIAFLPLLNVLLGEDAGKEMSEATVGNSNSGNQKHFTQSSPGSNHLHHSESDNSQLEWDNNDILMPFIESLEPGAGFQCLSLLLLNYLLQSEQGYDARIRACIKKLGVIIFIHELQHSDCEEVEQYQQIQLTRGKSVKDSLAEMATRKFESLEHTIASKLLRISAAQQQRRQEQEAKVVYTRGLMTRARIVRGIKIGTAGIATGTLLAVTGGLAAPGIAAGLAATGITTAATAGVVTTLTSTAAVTTVFGFGGGGLAAYKTHRRTKGITEFTFHKQRYRNADKDEDSANADLFSTICVSGWLKDDKDFERPWGVDPSSPPITDRLERLIRFYSIHKPEHICRCQEILRRWKGEERELWAVLREKYGQDPDHLYPIYDSPYRRILLTHEEDETVDTLLGELGYEAPSEEKNDGMMQQMKVKMDAMNASNDTFMRSASRTLNNAFTSSDGTQSQQEESNNSAISVWDYQMEYGGELLTLKWESEILVELCDSVSDMAADMAGQAAREVLKQTALAALITAVALPYAIVRAIAMIDGTWTLAIERADLAGIELAKTLLESEAGHRPVVLVGFSMGARAIYSCLKELARQQDLWEEEQEFQGHEKTAKKRGMRRGIHKNKRSEIGKRKFAREPASIVEDAIMMGLPNHLSLRSWQACRQIVAGRLVNCYSKNDMILSLMFQIKRLTGALRPVCGTSPVQVRGVENYNIGSLISAHSDYCTATSHILRMIYHGSPHRPSASIVAPQDSTMNGYKMT